MCAAGIDARYSDADVGVHSLVLALRVLTFAATESTTTSAAARGARSAWSSSPQ